MTPIFFSLAAITAVESPSLITIECFSVLRETAYSWLTYHKYAPAAIAIITLNIPKAISHCLWRRGFLFGEDDACPRSGVSRRLRNGSAEFCELLRGTFPTSGSVLLTFDRGRGRCSGWYCEPGRNCRSICACGRDPACGGCPADCGPDERG